MNEERLLRDAAGREPVTPSRLVAELDALGLRRGAVVIVHTSLSKLGWVPGGAQGVIAALLSVLGDDGTLVMPTHTGHLTDPRSWRAPPVPESWWETIREEMPAYDPAVTPTRATTRLARSMFGERSPLARRYELDGQALLAGVGHGNNTSIHLGEYRADFPDNERLEVLTRFLPDAETHVTQIRKRFRRKDVGHDDVLDALVAAVTATFADTSLRTFPEQPDRDSRGLPLEMVYALGQGLE